MNEHGAMQEFVAGEVQHDWNHDEIPRLCMLQASFQATKNADIKIDFSPGLLACHACLLLLACLLALHTAIKQRKPSLLGLGLLLLLLVDFPKSENQNINNGSLI